MIVISLGWGCQSFELAAMSRIGVLPKADAAINADTTHEQTLTYEFAERWTPWLEEGGIPVITVSASPKVTDIIKGVTPPYYTLNRWSAGQLHRTCTERWKIRPMHKWERQHLAKGEVVEKWIGITLDEISRVKPSNVSYEVNRYPFIEMFNPPMTRAMVIQWLKDNDLEIPVKSACIMCPYHDRKTWRQLQLADNGDWHKVLEIDSLIRNRRPGYSCYLTNERKPLDQCDFRSEVEHGQLGIWGDEECSGMCFL